MVKIENISVDWLDTSTYMRREFLVGEVTARGTVYQADGLSVPFDVPLSPDEWAEMQALLARIAARVEQRVTIAAPVGG